MLSFILATRRSSLVHSYHPAFSFIPRVVSPHPTQATHPLASRLRHDISPHRRKAKAKAKAKAPRACTFEPPEDRSNSTYPLFAFDRELYRGQHSSSLSSHSTLLTLLPFPARFPVTSLLFPILSSFSPFRLRLLSSDLTLVHPHCPLVLLSSLSLARDF